MAKEPNPKGKAEPKAPAKATAKPKAAPTATPTAGTVFRLKITLDWLNPPVWRRVEVPDCTLWDVHAIIQTCMPWTNSHMWEFTVGKNERYGMGDDMDFGGGWLDDDDVPSADDVRLSELANRGVKKFRYLYDFGDSWNHIITFEKSVPRDPTAKYPRCVAGERACPPDDCGGAPGYLSLLDTLADPKHPDHKDMLEWAGGPIDPEAFDLDATNKALARLKIK